MKICNPTSPVQKPHTVHMQHFTRTRYLISRLLWPEPLPTFHWLKALVKSRLKQQQRRLQMSESRRQVHKCRLAATWPREPSRGTEESKWWADKWEHTMHRPHTCGRLRAALHNMARNRAEPGKRHWAAIHSHCEKRDDKHEFKGIWWHTWGKGCNEFPGQRPACTAMRHMVSALPLIDNKCSVW